LGLLETLLRTSMKWGKTERGKKNVRQHGLKKGIQNRTTVRKNDTSEKITVR